MSTTPTSAMRGKTVLITGANSNACCRVMPALNQSRAVVGAGQTELMRRYARH
jgi:hypothetical protein